MQLLRLIAVKVDDLLYFVSWFADTQRSNGTKHVSYGTSELVNPEQFIEELKKLA